MAEQFFHFVPGGSATTPAGWLACGVKAGLKKSGNDDMALLFSPRPASFAGVFTSCTFAAAPVQVDRARCGETATLQAVLVNSGNANACTGQAGLDNARQCCALVAAGLGIPEESVMVSSTGRIGVQLPMDVMARGIGLACGGLREDGGGAAARAIMTTDTVPKHGAVTVDLGNGQSVAIGAMTKGVGMIAPELVPPEPHATMLCYITTDAVMDNALLAELLADGAEQSFNRITVDGDMSTNDTVLLLANGASGVAVAAGSPEAGRFRTALHALMRELARAMVMDGEGATKFVTVRVENAPDREAAKLCCRAIANSLLCKTAWFGCDPNWGRLVAALGYSKARFDPWRVDVFYDHLPVVRAGGDAGTPEADLAQVLRNREFTVRVDLHGGSAEYWMWSCDISYDYVKINAEYHT